MFRRFSCWVLLVVAGFLANRAPAQNYQPFKLNEGPVLTARIMSAKDGFLQLALEGGGYTNIQWGRFTQETIQQLAQSRDKNVKQFASAFLDIRAEDLAAYAGLQLPKPKGSANPTPANIKLQEVPRMPRLTSGSFFSSSVIWVILGLIYLGNIFAGYEIGIFRNYPAGLTAGAAAVVPFVAPLVFLCMPNRVVEPVLAPLEQEATHAAMHGAITMSAAEEAPTPAAIAAAAAAAAAAGPPPGHTTYVRGQFTFNRRFFETKLAGFLKLVPGEAEKDKEIFVRSVRGDFVATRLTKLEAAELFLHVTEGNASKDVMIPYNEVKEITIRPKAGVPAA